jgi:hypothetical protein
MADTDEEEKARLRAAQDFADAEAEMAGIDNGKIRRFTTSEEFKRAADARNGKHAETLAEKILREMTYEQVQTYVMQDLRIQDRAADMALRDIDRDIRHNREQHEKLLDNAYRLDDGRRVFMTRDSTAAYDEEGKKLSDHDFAKLPKQELLGHTKWDQLEASDAGWKQLKREREQVVQYQTEGRDLARRVASGKLSKDDLERFEEKHEENMPARLRSHVDQIKAESTPDAPQSPGILSADELAKINARPVSAAASVFGRTDFPDAPKTNRDFNAAAAGTVVSGTERIRPSVIAPAQPSAGPP